MPAAKTRISRPFGAPTSSPIAINKIKPTERIERERERDGAAAVLLAKPIFFSLNNPLEMLFFSRGSSIKHINNPEGVSSLSLGLLLLITNA